MTVYSGLWLNVLFVCFFLILDRYLCSLLCITRRLSWHCKRTDISWCSCRSSKLCKSTSMLITFVFLL